MRPAAAREGEESAVRRRAGTGIIRCTDLPSSIIFERRRRRIVVVVCCLISVLFVLGGWEANPKRLAVTLVRSTVVPALRRCLPKGKVPDGDIKFALTSMYLPRDGPAHWNERQREMLALSERNKARYCEQVRAGGNVCTYLNGTKWAEEHYATTPSYAGLDQIKGSERGVWFKPAYLQSLLRNLTPSSNEVEAFDWVMYMDADVMIVNFDFDLRSLLAGIEDVDATIIAKDAENPINAGILLVRANRLGMAVTDGWFSDPKASERTTDQAFLAEMFDPESGIMREKYATRSISNSTNGTANGTEAVRPRMKVVKQCALAAGGGIEVDPETKMPFVEGAYARGDFAVHFFGRPDKLEQMRIVDEGSLGFLSR